MFFFWQKSEQADSTLFIIFFLSLEKKQQQYQFTPAPLQAQRRTPERWEVGEVPGGPEQRATPRPQRAEAQVCPALPGPVSPWNLGVFFCFLGSVSPRASFIKVPSGKVNWQRDVGREASGITRLFELPSPPVWDRVGKGDRRWVLGGRRCRAPPPPRR